MVSLEKTPLDLSQGQKLTEIAAADPFVTGSSRWASSRWKLDGRTPGYAPFTIRWWPEETTPELLGELKLLAAALFTSGPAALRMKYSSAPQFAIAARYLARFMAEKSYFSLAELDLAAFRVFTNHLRQAVGNVATRLDDPTPAAGDADQELDDGEPPTAPDPGPDEAGEEVGTELASGRNVDDVEEEHEAPARGEADRPDRKDVEVDRRSVYFVQLRLSIWKHLHQARAVMARAGVTLQLTNPFRDLSLRKQARGLAADGLSTMEDLPDEVVLPILTEAHRLIGEPADQVVAMLEDYFAIGGRSRATKQAVTDARRALVGRQTFRIRHEAQPWFVPQASRSEPHIVMMDLVRMIRCACVIVLSAGIGWRISEASSVEIEDRDDLGPLPSCILTTQSFTRTSDHFWIRALLSKHRPEPTPDDWLIGARLSGTDTEPMTVRAVRVLERLYRPFRRLSDTLALRSQLIVSWYGTGVSFEPRNVTRIRADRLRIDAQEFIRDRVGLAQRLAPLVADNPRLAPYQESGGECIRPHQWRRTFFRMMYRTDPNLHPAISRHFKHVSLAVTEDGYAPRSPEALEEAESVATAELVEILYARGEDGPPPVTGGDKMLERNRRMIASIIDGRPVDEAAPRLAQFAASRGLRLWPAEHGSCLIGLNPDKAACHVRHGRMDWRADRPNLSRRNPGLCCSCPNLVVTRRNLPFWSRRYRQNRKAWLDSGKDPAFRFARDRAHQARTILEHLGWLPTANEKEETR